MKSFLAFGLCILFLTACGGKDADPVYGPENVNNDITTSAPTPADIATQIGFSYNTANTKVIFNPVTGDVSLPTFTLFSNTADGTASVTIDENSAPNPVTQALNGLDGWSTTAPINIHFRGALNPSTPCTLTMASEGAGCLPNVFLLPLNITSDGDVLDPSAIDTHSPVNSTLLSTTQIRASVVTLGTEGDTVRISPLRPLANQTMYLLVITNGLQDTSNMPVGPSPMYQILSDTSDTAFNAIGYPASLNALRPLIMSTEQIAVGTINSILGAATIAQDDIVYTHLMTTTDANQPLNILAHPGTINPGLANLPSLFPDQFASPRQSGFYSQNSVQTLVSSLPQSSLFNQDALVVQGAIALPYYLPAPTSSATPAETGPLIQAGRWQPSTTISAAIGSVPEDTVTRTTSLNGTINSQSYNVTYRYPFPEKQSDTVVPVTVVRPHGAKPTNGWPVVVLVHGITSDRSALLLLATELANACNKIGLAITPNCFASVMIDLPLHGQHANSTNPVLAIANTGALPSALQSVRERHFGITYNAQGASPAEQFLPTDTVPSSGSLFVNIGHFHNTRDHLKQAVMDQLNLLASLGTMDVDSNSSNGPDFNLDEVYMAGHSLGGIMALTTVAAANLGSRAEIPRIRASALLNTGGQVTRLLENSPHSTFGAPAILAGLSSAGLSQNTKDYEAFFNVFQSLLDSADPINFSGQLAGTQTPAYFMTIIGDGSAQSADQVIPVDADNNPNAPFGNAQAAPLAGTNPLIATSGAVTLSPGDYTDGDDPAFNGAIATAPKRVAVNFTQGQHSTAVLPASTSELSIFYDLVNHISTFFTLNGAGLHVTNNSGAVQ